MSRRRRLAASVGLAVLAAWAEAARAAPVDSESGEDGQPVVNVVAHREAAVFAGAAPIEQFSAADIAGFGASDLGDLISALGLEARGADGSAPVILLNGVRVSSLAQLRDLPPEALLRVDIYPGDVAVRLGYRPEQRVMNFVLRPSYRDVAAEAGGSGATDGGAASGRARLGADRIRPGQRLSLSATYEHADWLLESERPIAGGFGRLRTLIPESDHVVLNGVYAGAIGDVSTSLNASLGGTWSRSRLGPPATDVLLAGPPLARDGSGATAHLGVTFNGKLGGWQWSLVGNADHSQDRTLTDRDPIVIVDGSSRDLARATESKGDADVLLFGPVAKLPAGELTAAIEGHLDGEREEDLERSVGGDVRSTTRFTHDQLQASLDVPLLSGAGALAPFGKLTASLSFGREGFSDFHSLDNSRASLMWQPFAGVSLVASRSRQARAPSIVQLADPVLATPNVTVFDFVRGETATVTRIDGGNPALRPERDTTTSVSLLLRPIAAKQLLISANFTDTRREGQIGSPAVTSPAFEQAFPGRFVRDGAGRLVSIDARPVNFATGDQQVFRWGFTLLRPLEGAAAGGSDGGGWLQLSFFHTWRLKDRQQLFPGGPELDYLRGDAGPGATGQPEHELELSADLSRGGIGGGLSGEWKSGARINRAAAAVDELTASRLLVLNLKLHAAGAVDGPPALRGVLFSLSVDNLFDSRPRIRDGLGATPSAYQPAYLDPLGRVVRLSLRKLF